ncbi:MAG: hypothetical protein HUK02_03600 [Bacteroidaceae bacterium]|nr:hypothetical protein [Bacteroidaceae bacterium]
MRNRLLPLFGMAFVAGVANAQSWSEPKLDVDVTNPVLSEPVSGQEFMVMNMETKLFMTFGNAWGTQSSVGEVDNASTYLLNDSITYVDGEIDPVHTGWTFWNTTGNFASEHSGRGFMFYDSPDGSYQDMGVQGHNFFELAKQENGTYRIRTCAGDARYGQNGTEIATTGWDYENYWFGPVKPDPDPEVMYENTVVYPNGTAETHALDWGFINVSTYKVRVDMYNMVVAAQDAGIDADLSEYQAVYDNESATYEQLLAAKAAMKEAIAHAKVAVLDDATEADPIDATFLLENPNFDGNINGWDCSFVSGTNATNIGYQGANYENNGVTINQFIEAWANSDFSADKRGGRHLGDGQLSQTIAGLPAGKYSFECDCVANYQDGTKDNTTGVELFAIGGGVDTFKSMATGNGQPEHFAVTFVSTGGDLTIGLRTRDASANWIAADNFTLMYYGPLADDPYKVVLDAAIEEYLEQYGDFEALRANAEVVEAWETALEDAQNATENYQEAKAALDEAAATLKTSLAAYVKLNAAATEARAKAVEAERSYDELFAQLTDLASELTDAYEEGTYTNEQCEGLETLVIDMISEYVSANAKEGDDVSILINNPRFDTAFSGWQTSGAGAVWGGTNEVNSLTEYADGTPAVQPGEIGSGNAERYHDVFSVYQTIKNMPAGLYSLTCQAFERQDDGNPAAAVIYAIVDGKEQNVPIKNIWAEPSPERLLVTVDGDGNETWPGDVGDEESGYVPNSMSGANVHFHLGRYQNKFTIIVEEPGDITVGIKTDSNANWILFDNFGMIFEGNNPEAWQSAIDGLVASANALYDANMESSTLPAQDALSELIAAAEESTEGTGEQMKAAYEALRAGMDVFKENVNAYAKIESELYDLILVQGEEYAEYCDDEAVYEKWNEYCEWVSDPDHYGEMTTDELVSFLEDGKALIAQMKTIYDNAIEQERVSDETREAMASASDDEPVDATEFLNNPDFEADGSNGRTVVGWNLWGNGGNCVYYNNAFGQSGNNGVECWNPSGLEFDINQVLYTLPAGTYALGADLANSKNGVGSNNTTGRAHLYVEVTLADGSTKMYRSDEVAPQDAGCNDAHATYECIFAVPEGAKSVKVGAKNFDGVMEWRWFMCDNYTLTYFGTESEQETNDYVDAIEAVEAKATTVRIYSLDGKEQTRLLKGVNIIKTTMADGSIRVNKILVR